MANAAGGRGFAELVTVGAGSHGDVLLLLEDILRADASVAYIAIGFCVLLVAKRNEARELVHANPRNRLVVFCQYGQLLDFSFPFRRVPVTRDAFRHVWNAQLIAVFCWRVAILAFDAGVHVSPMTECRRLRRRSPWRAER